MNWVSTLILFTVHHDKCVFFFTCIIAHISFAYLFYFTDRDRLHQLRWKAVHCSSADVKPSTTDADGPCTHFIHGRHTCDGCLTTPIIGLRWHSTNLPDYDLCDRCKGNYKGDDIKFEAVELDRDRAFQTRWQRRQVRRARQARFAHSRYAERSRCGKSMSSVQAAAEAAAASATTATASSKTAASETKGTEVMDVALKEAIRRSLADTNTNNDSASEEDLADGDEAKPAAETEVENTKTTVEVTEESKVSPKAPGPMSVGDEYDTLAIKFRAMHRNDAKYKYDHHQLCEDSAMYAAAEVEKKKKKSADVGDEAPSTPTKKDADDAMITTPPSAKSNFSKEAEGIGDTAEQIGVTLDACACAIDAIVTELDSKAAEKCPPENPSAPPIEDMEAPDSISAMTSSILSDNPKKENEEQNEMTPEGTNAGKEDGNGDDDWDMVSESSDALAKATEAIGSALFDFDKKSSTDLAESGIDSIPSSVPTVSSSADKWAKELTQLYELGFIDQKASIGALDLLNKEAEAPVPIENVVDYLCATAETDDEADD